ncbi:MFS transporter [Streptomyces puniciscabiei]
MATASPIPPLRRVAVIPISRSRRGGHSENPTVDVGNHASARSSDFGVLVRLRNARPFLLIAFAARLPYAMLPLGIVFLVHHAQGSYAAAGAAGATALVCEALAGPHTARLADRLGVARALVPGVLVHTAAVAALLACLAAHASEWAVIACCGVAGAAVPQMRALVRARWTSLLGAEAHGRKRAKDEDRSKASLVQCAFAVESGVEALIAVLGPVVVTALCACAGPYAVLITEAGAVLISGLVFAGFSRNASEHHGNRSQASHGGAMAAPGVRVLTAVAFGVGTVFGSVPVTMVAYAGRHDETVLGGVLCAVFSLGTLLASLTCSRLGGKHPVARRLMAAYAALVAGCLLLQCCSTTMALSMGALFCGMAIAPVVICCDSLAHALTPAANRTEAFAWIAGGVGSGAAVGTAGAGQLAEVVSPSAGFLVCAAGTAVAFVVLVLARRLLSPSAHVTRALGASHSLDAALDLLQGSCCPGDRGSRGRGHGRGHVGLVQNRARLSHHGPQVQYGTSHAAVRRPEPSRPRTVTTGHGVDRGTTAVVTRRL